MGAGSSPAGAGLAGFDPIVPLPAPVPPPAPGAWMFDPNAREFPFDANGYAVTVHPVDQIAEISLGSPLGGWASAPDTGIDVARLKNSTPQTVATAEQDAANLALAEPLANGDITLKSVAQDPDADGRPIFTSTYVNNRLPTVPTPSQNVPSLLPR